MTAFAIWCVAGFLASTTAVGLTVKPLARRLLDKPSHRSSHTQPTPTGGGAAVVLAWLVAVLVAVWLGQVVADARLRAALVCAVVLMPVGLIDDWRDLPRSVRYGAHCGVAVTALVFAAQSGQSVLALSVLTAPLLFLAITGAINLVNFMDGIDGLVAGTGTIILAAVAYWTSDLVWALAAATYAGFLVFNKPPAKIFMGDAGSTTLGGLIAIAFLFGGAARWERFAVLLPLLGDATYTLGRRLLRGENVLKAHHSHLYQRLLRSGLTHGPISLGYAVATLGAAVFVELAGPAGGVVALGAWLAGVIAIERYVAARGVPFTRPARASSSA